MAELITIARPYAEAAFQLAQETRQLSAWSAQLDTLAQVAAAPEVAELIGNPAVSSQQLQALFVGALKQTALPEVERFVAVLLDNRRADALPQIADLFDELKDQAENVVDAQVESAFPLSVAQIDDLVQSLEKRFKRKVKVNVTVAPELIGGVRIQVGDDVIDASVQGKLQAMAYRLKS